MTKNNEWLNKEVSYIEIWDKLDKIYDQKGAPSGKPSFYREIHSQLYKISGETKGAKKPLKWWLEKNEHLWFYEKDLKEWDI